MIFVFIRTQSSLKSQKDIDDKKVEAKKSTTVNNVSMSKEKGKKVEKPLNQIPGPHLPFPYRVKKEIKEWKPSQIYLYVKIVISEHSIGESS